MHDLLKYKALFYEETFNKDLAKSLARQLYARYMAVTATSSIFCSKADRLRIHALIIGDSEDSASAPTPYDQVNLNRNSTTSKPVYEGQCHYITVFIFLLLLIENKC